MIRFGKELVGFYHALGFLGEEIESNVESGEWTECSDSLERVARDAQKRPRRSGPPKSFNMSDFLRNDLGKLL